MTDESETTMTTGNLPTLDLDNRLAVMRTLDRRNELLAELDTLRADIAAGNIVDYALATVYCDRRVGAQWSKTVDKWRLVGAIENLKIDLMAGGS